MGGFISACIIATLWGVCSMIMYIPHAPYVKDLKESDKNLVMILFLLGGPALAIANVIEQILDNILPPGWGGDDDDFISKF